MPELTYRGTVEGLRRYVLPQLRRAGMRGWTLKKDLDRIRRALAKSSQSEDMGSGRMFEGLLQGLCLTEEEDPCDL
ncbi:MAG: hypothetical protein ACOX3V_08925 [Bacillota bacterium]